MLWGPSEGAKSQVPKSARHEREIMQPLVTGGMGKGPAMLWNFYLYIHQEQLCCRARTGSVLNGRSLSQGRLESVALPRREPGWCKTAAD